MSEKRLSDGERERQRGMVRELLEEAEAVLDALPADEKPHHTEEVVAVCYARLGDVAAARRLVDRWSDHYVRTYVLKSIAICQWKFGDGTGALKTVGEAVASARLNKCKDSGISQLVHLTDTLIASGESSAARDLLSETTTLARGAIDPEATCGLSWMTELVECELRLSGTSAAEQVVSELLDHLPSYRLVQMQNIVHRMAREGSFRNAIELAESIPDMTLRAGALHGIADAHETREIATEILRECVNLYATRQDPDGRAAGLRDLAMSMHAKAMDSDSRKSLLAARDSLMEFSSLYYRAKFLANLASDFFEIGRPDDARETLVLAEQVVDMTPDPSSRMYQCIAIAEAYLKIGDRDEGRSRFEAAAAFAWAADEDNEEFWLPCEVVDSAAQAGFTELAQAIADELTGERRIFALAKIVEPMLSRQSDDTVREILAEIMQLTSQLDDRESQADNLSYFSLEHAKLNDLDTALLCAREIGMDFASTRAGALVNIASNLLDRLGAPDPDED